MSDVGALGASFPRNIIELWGTYLDDSFFADNIEKLSDKCTCCMVKEKRPG